LRYDKNRVQPVHRNKLDHAGERAACPLSLTAASGADHRLKFLGEITSLGRLQREHAKADAFQPINIERVHQLEQEADLLRSSSHDEQRPRGVGFQDAVCWKERLRDLRHLGSADVPEWDHVHTEALATLGAADGGDHLAVRGLECFLSQPALGRKQLLGAGEPRTVWKMRACLPISALRARSRISPSSSRAAMKSRTKPSAKRRATASKRTSLFRY